MSVRALEASEKRTLAILGLPTAALALAITVVTTYVPVAASEFLDSSVVIGGLIAIEGVLALWLPLVVGSWSDRLRTSIGGRLPFLVAATPIACVSLAVTGVVETLPLMALTVTVFFVAYFIAYEPVPRAVPRPHRRRDRRARAVHAGDLAWHGNRHRAHRRRPARRLGDRGALRRRGDPLRGRDGRLPLGRAAACPPARTHSRSSDTESVMEEAFSLGSVVRGHPEMRAYLVANALWESSLGALKTFVFLFITVGLGHSQAASAGIVGGVALLILPAAVLSGKLADRYGRLRAMVWVLPLYGFGQLVPAFTDSIAILIPIMLIVGFGGGLVMTLPYALLQPLMPHGRHGTLTGFYSLSRGIGTAIGPLLAGVAIEVLGGPFGSTEGYAAMWLVCGGSILLSIPFLMRLRTLAGHIIDPDTEPPRAAAATA